MPTRLLNAAVEDLIATATGRTARIEGRRGVGGGCIHDSGLVELDDGRRFFVKSNAAPLPRIFELEREGLEALRATETLRVPEVLGVGGGQGGVPAFLVLEAIETGTPASGFMEGFGRGLAFLHSVPATAAGPEGRTFGFGNDNYLGATPQPNGWCHGWVDFWHRHRLGHQLELARSQGRSTHQLDHLGDRLMERLEGLIGEPDEPAALLHGDLWGGNYLVDGRGQPVLVDPAAYYGRREADLAMTRLFGGFDSRFYAAYHEVWPLAPGSEERLAVYELYHLLNHLNLFGSGYLSGCLARLRQLC